MQMKIVKAGFEFKLDYDPGCHSPRDSYGQAESPDDPEAIEIQDIKITSLVSVTEFLEKELYSELLSSAREQSKSVFDK